MTDVPSTAVNAKTGRTREEEQVILHEIDRHMAEIERVVPVLRASVNRGITLPHAVNIDAIASVADALMDQIGHLLRRAYRVASSEAEFQAAEKQFIDRLMAETHNNPSADTIASVAALFGDDILGHIATTPEKGREAVDEPSDGVSKVAREFFAN